MNRADRRAAGRARGRPSIEVHIGELSLSGFPRLSGADVAEAVRAELTRLIAEHGLPARLSTPGGAGRMRGAPIAGAGGAAAAVGRQIAGAVIDGPAPRGPAAGGRRS